MKGNALILIAAAVALVLCAAFLFLIPSLQSPEDTLNARIAEKLETAQRMLYAYQPAGERLLDAVEAADTQPAGPPPRDQWPEHLTPLEQGIQAQQGELQKLARQFVDLGGEPGRPPGAGSYTQLEGELRANVSLIDQALQLVQTAIRDTEGEASGRQHPEATRFQAVLLYHKADLLRRRAATRLLRAREGWEDVAELTSRWRAVRAKLVALAPDLGDAMPAPVEIDEPATEREPGESGDRGLLGKLASALFGDKEANADAPDAGETVTIVVDPQDEPGEMPDEPAAEPVEGPTIDERLAETRSEIEKTTADIATARAELDDLQTRVDELDAKLTTARQAEEKARKRMFELEGRKLDALHPEELEAFEKDYKAASEARRQAAREVALLEQGAIRNARPATEDEADLLDAPLGPIDPDKNMEPQRGLVSLRIELAGAKDHLTALEALKSSLETRAEELVHLRDSVTQEARRLRTRQERLAEAAMQAAQSATALMIDADRFATQAIELLENEGMQAARTAQQAAQSRISDARNAGGTGENARLKMITDSQFLVGHAQTLEADMEFLRGRLLAQRLTALEHQRRMLDDVQRMGMVPSSWTFENAPDEVPAYLVNAAAAADAVRQAQTGALEAGELALQLYRDAEQPLRQAWVVRANAAAVNYFLANLADEPDATNYREAAIEMYDEALRDRADSPAAVPYRPILDGLTSAMP